MANGPKKTAAIPATPAVTPEASAAAAPAVNETIKAIETPVASMSELQGNLRTVVAKGLVETRAAYAKAKVGADEAASALETSYAAAKSGAAAINAKALDALRANVEANFDFVKSAIAVSSLADYMTLQGEFTRKRLEAMKEQTKEFGALAQKVAQESVEPIKAQVSKSFHIAV